MPLEDLEDEIRIKVDGDGLKEYTGPLVQTTIFDFVDNFGGFINKTVD